MKNNLTQKVLVLDGSELSTLAIVRSLGRKHIKVTVASERGANLPIAFASKYAEKTLFYADPLADSDKFVTEIIDYIKNNHFDLLIPVTDKTVVPLAKHKQEIQEYVCLAAPDADVLEFVNNKHQTFVLAESLEIPIPKSSTIRSSQELTDILPQLSYPVVIKPSRSIAGIVGDMRVHLSVQYAFSVEELNKKCLQILPYSPVLLQEYFVGDGVGVEILADQGNVIYAFQHKRIHELPLTGGGSCLRESVAVNPQLLAYSETLIKAINWHGVAMIEFKFCEKTQRSCLMEINGRFWGSLALAVNAGADFPYYLYQLHVLGTHTTSPKANTGVQSRKLKEDLYWFIIVLLRLETSPLASYPSLSQLCREVVSVFSRRHYFDSFASDDFQPGLQDIKRTGRWLAGLLYQKIENWWLKAKFNSRKKRGSINKSLVDVKYILFLCYGNINRSCLAEKSLNTWLLPKSNQYVVTSAGFHPKPNRPADPKMVAIAHDAGLDLSNWTSNQLDDTMLAAADIILVMEIRHYHIICQKFPAYRHKTQLLGSVIANNIVPLEIADPYGQTIDSYQQCFREVNIACKAIADLLN